MNRYKKFVHVDYVRYLFKILNFSILDDDQYILKIKFKTEPKHLTEFFFFADCNISISISYYVHTHITMCILK